MRPPPPREPSSRVAASLRRPAHRRRADDPHRRSGPLSPPRAHRPTSRHRRSVAEGAAAGRVEQVDRDRIWRRRSWWRSGDRRPGFGGEFGGPADASARGARPWGCVSRAGPSDAALRLPSSICPRPPAGSASSFRPYIWAPSDAAVRLPSSICPRPPAGTASSFRPLLPNVRNMSGGGEDPYRQYSQPDGSFGSGYFPMPPPFSGRGSQGPPQGPPEFDLNNAFTAYGATSTHGGMPGPSPGFTGYGMPPPYYPMPYHSSGVPMPEPARHSTSSLPSFPGGPYTMFRPYGEGTSHHPPSWHSANIGEEEMSSAAPRASQRQEFFGMSYCPSPANDVASNDQSMAYVGGSRELASGSSSSDNEAVLGNTTDLEEEEEEEGNEDSMDSQGEGSEGDLGDLIGPGSSDEEYERLYKRWEESLGIDNPVYKGIKIATETSRVTCKLMKKAIIQGMYEEYARPRHVREIVESGRDFVERTLRSPTACYNTFRMHAHVFESLHEELVSKYGLRSTTKCGSREALGIFLYMVGPAQPVRQADSRFERSMGTISRKFNLVLSCMSRLAKDIIAPKDPTFSSVHHKVANHRAAPFFNNAIGAIDGTHVKVVVPFEKVGQYINRKNDKTQNVLAVCDFDRRFTFVAAGVPGSAHDWTVLQEAIRKYGPAFPHPPAGKFYLVDAGYPNRPGYLSPYKGYKYHQQQWRRGPGPSGERELFNKAHSSLRSIIEQSFGVLKMKWRILLVGIPSYQESIQTDIIIACCALHNYIVEHDDDDIDFEMANYARQLGVLDDDDDELRREADEARLCFLIHVSNLVL